MLYKRIGVMILVYRYIVVYSTSLAVHGKPEACAEQFCSIELTSLPDYRGLTVASALLARNP